MAFIFSDELSPGSETILTRLQQKQVQRNQAVRRHDKLSLGELQIYEFLTKLLPHLCYSGRQQIDAKDKDPGLYIKLFNAFLILEYFLVWEMYPVTNQQYKASPELANFVTEIYPIFGDLVCLVRKYYWSIRATLSKDITSAEAAGLLLAPPRVFEVAGRVSALSGNDPGDWQTNFQQFTASPISQNYLPIANPENKASIKNFLENKKFADWISYYIKLLEIFMLFLKTPVQEKNISQLDPKEVAFLMGIRKLVLNALATRLWLSTEVPLTSSQLSIEDYIGERRRKLNGEVVRPASKPIDLTYVTKCFVCKQDRPNREMTACIGACGAAVCETCVASQQCQTCRRFVCNQQDCIKAHECLFQRRTTTLSSLKSAAGAAANAARGMAGAAASAAAKKFGGLGGRHTVSASTSPPVITAATARPTSPVVPSVPTMVSPPVAQSAVAPAATKGATSLYVTLAEFQRRQSLVAAPATNAMPREPRTEYSEIDVAATLAHAPKCCNCNNPIMEIHSMDEQSCSHCGAGVCLTCLSSLRPCARGCVRIKMCAECASELSQHEQVCKGPPSCCQCERQKPRREMSSTKCRGCNAEICKGCISTMKLCSACGANLCKMCSQVEAEEPGCPACR